MKAIVQTGPGGPETLSLRTLPTPAPGPNEVLVRVCAATVTVGDVILRRMPALMRLPMRVFFGVPTKRVPGHEFAGIVAETGLEVTRFKAGDAVVGTTTGLPVGANAEFVCVPERANGCVLAAKPAELADEAAAALLIGGMAAWQLLKPCDLRPGRRILIYGASGSVGTFAVQIARHLGAEVTGVCSTRNVDLVAGLGAARVIDYTKEAVAPERTDYDAVFDAVGKSPPGLQKTALKTGGCFVSVSTPTKEDPAELDILLGLAKCGAIRSVIDRRFPLERTAEAHAYVEAGHKQGNVVIRITEAVL